MLVARVVGYEIQKDADAARPRLGDEPIEFLQGADIGLEGHVVRDVVAPVHIRRERHRTEPDPVDPEPLEMVEMVDDTVQVAYPVRVRIGERTKVYLVEDAGLPPWRSLRRGLLAHAGGSGFQFCTTTQHTP